MNLIFGLSEFLRIACLNNQHVAVQQLGLDSDRDCLPHPSPR